MKSASENIRLITSPEDAPRWIVENIHHTLAEIREANIREHIAILLDSSRVDEIRF
jgi:hypothetical protein